MVLSCLQVQRLKEMEILVLLVSFATVLSTLAAGDIMAQGMPKTNISGNNTNQTASYITNLVEENYADLVRVEHESNEFVVLNFAEIDSTIGWDAVQTVMDKGNYKIESVLSSGMGSVGNPTRFFVVLSGP
jgi:hypothetical protein